MQHTTLHRLVGIALLGAIAYILMLLEFPILPVAPWMKIDFSDIPILIGLFLFGVGGAFVITIIKLLLHSAMMGFAIYDLIGSFASFLGPFNLIKGLLVGNVFWLVYQRLAKWLGNHNQLMSRI
ncbi:ECF transporter S component [Lactiplantibacillus plantarum]|uniref:ECF transporter S component n=1 Tax=Lactiplantibacillus plantarum TaxID=1590 RepID=UPI0008637697|nr:Gx transporter family protein [Lactiplantibacillus plantarum]